ncbi:MAG: hypothetical protein WB987_01715 [Candidatus Acidiferrales bacterium]
MKKSFCKGTLAAAILVFVVCGPSRAQVGDRNGCSLATLRGDYAFTLHGESIGILVPGVNGAPPALKPFANPLLADGVAITRFDGNGGLSQIDVVMRNGTSAATPATPVTDNGFRTQETGTYKVESDCTGTFAIRFPDTSEIDVAFVLAKNGLEIRTVVTRQHVPMLPPAIIPPGVACAPLTTAETSGCDLGVQIRSEGVKVRGILF